MVGVGTTVVDVCKVGLNDGCSVVETGGLVGSRDGPDKVGEMVLTGREAGEEVPDDDVGFIKDGGTRVVGEDEGSRVRCSPICIGADVGTDDGDELLMVGTLLAARLEVG